MALLLGFTLDCHIRLTFLGSKQKNCASVIHMGEGIELHIRESINVLDIE